MTLPLTLPAILFGIVLSTTYGTAFHVWKGGSLKKLFLYIVLAWLGFWIGHSVGNSFGWRFAHVGTLNTGMATVGSLIFLLVGDWLSRVEITHK
jgi:hypothetical protein